MTVRDPGSPRVRDTRPSRGSLWRASDREELRARLARLSPDARPRWGRLTAPVMLAHLIDAARLGLGEIAPVARNRGVARLLRHTPVKQVFVYLLPFPRHAPRVEELFATQPSDDWQHDLATLDALTDRLAARARDRDARWPAHPYFGALSVRAWGVLGYAHTDHHLRQFGV